MTGAGVTDSYHSTTELDNPPSPLHPKVDDDDYDLEDSSTEMQDDSTPFCQFIGDDVYEEDVYIDPSLSEDQLSPSLSHQISIKCDDEAIVDDGDLDATVEGDSKDRDLEKRPTDADRVSESEKEDTSNLQEQEFTGIREQFDDTKQSDPLKFDGDETSRGPKPEALPKDREEQRTDQDQLLKGEDNQEQSGSMGSDVDGVNELEERKKDFVMQTLTRIKKGQSITPETHGQPMVLDYSERIVAFYNPNSLLDAACPLSLTDCVINGFYDSKNGHILDKFSLVSYSIERAIDLGLIDPQLDRFVVDKTNLVYNLERAVRQEVLDLSKGNIQSMVMSNPIDLQSAVNQGLLFKALSPADVLTNYSLPTLDSQGNSQVLVVVPRVGAAENPRKRDAIDYDTKSIIETESGNMVSLKQMGVELPTIFRLLNSGQCQILDRSFMSTERGITDLRVSFPDLSERITLLEALENGLLEIDGSTTPTSAYYLSPEGRWLSLEEAFENGLMSLNMFKLLSQCFIKLTEGEIMNIPECLERKFIDLRSGKISIPTSPRPLTFEECQERGIMDAETTALLMLTSCSYAVITNVITSIQHLASPITKAKQKEFEFDIKEHEEPFENLDATSVENLKPIVIVKEPIENQTLVDIEQNWKSLVEIVIDEASSVGSEERDDADNVLKGDGKGHDLKYDMSHDIEDKTSSNKEEFGEQYTDLLERFGCQKETEMPSLEDDEFMSYLKDQVKKEDFEPEDLLTKEELQHPKDDQGETSDLSKSEKVEDSAKTMVEEDKEKSSDTYDFGLDDKYLAEVEAEKDRAHEDDELEKSGCLKDVKEPSLEDDEFMSYLRDQVKKGDFEPHDLVSKEKLEISTVRKEQILDPGKVDDSGRKSDIFEEEKKAPFDSGDLEVKDTDKMGTDQDLENDELEKSVCLKDIEDKEPTLEDDEFLHYLREQVKKDNIEPEDLFSKEEMQQPQDEHEERAEDEKGEFSDEITPLKEETQISLNLDDFGLEDKQLDKLKVEKDHDQIDDDLEKSSCLKDIEEKMPSLEDDEFMSYLRDQMKREHFESGDLHSKEELQHPQDGHEEISDLPREEKVDSDQIWHVKEDKEKLPDLSDPGLDSKQLDKMEVEKGQDQEIDLEKHGCLKDVEDKVPTMEDDEFLSYLKDQVQRKDSKSEDMVSKEELQYPKADGDDEMHLEKGKVKSPDSRDFGDDSLGKEEFEKDQDQEYDDLEKSGCLKDVEDKVPSIEDDEFMRYVRDHIKRDDFKPEDLVSKDELEIPKDDQKEVLDSTEDRKAEDSAEISHPEVEKEKPSDKDDDFRIRDEHLDKVEKDQHEENDELEKSGCLKDVEDTMPSLENDEFMSYLREQIKREDPEPEDLLTKEELSRPKDDSEEIRDLDTDEKIGDSEETTLLNKDKKKSSDSGDFGIEDKQLDEVESEKYHDQETDNLEKSGCLKDVEGKLPLLEDDEFMSYLRDQIKKDDFEAGDMLSKDELQIPKDEQEETLDTSKDGMVEDYEMKHVKEGKKPSDSNEFGAEDKPSDKAEAERNRDQEHDDLEKSGCLKDVEDKVPSIEDDEFMHYLRDHIKRDDFKPEDLVSKDELEIPKDDQREDTEDRKAEDSDEISHPEVEKEKPSDKDDDFRIRDEHLDKVEKDQHEENDELEKSGCLKDVVDKIPSLDDDEFMSYLREQVKREDFEPEDSVSKEELQIPKDDHEEASVSKDEEFEDAITQLKDEEKPPRSDDVGLEDKSLDKIEPEKDLDQKNNELEKSGCLKDVEDKMPSADDDEFMSYLKDHVQREDLASKEELQYPKDQEEIQDFTKDERVDSDETLHLKEDKGKSPDSDDFGIEDKKLDEVESEKYSDQENDNLEKSGCLKDVEGKLPLLEDDQFMSYLRDQIKKDDFEAGDVLPKDELQISKDDLEKDFDSEAMHMQVEKDKTPDSDESLDKVVEDQYQENDELEKSGCLKDVEDKEPTLEDDEFLHYLREQVKKDDFEPEDLFSKEEMQHPKDDYEDISQTSFKDGKVDDSYSKEQVKEELPETDDFGVRDERVKDDKTDEKSESLKGLRKDYDPDSNVTTSEGLSFGLDKDDSSLNLETHQDSKFDDQITLESSGNKIEISFTVNKNDVFVKNGEVSDQQLSEDNRSKLGMDSNLPSVDISTSFDRSLESGFRITAESSKDIEKDDELGSRAETKVSELEPKDVEVSHSQDVPAEDETYKTKISEVPYTASDAENSDNDWKEASDEFAVKDDIVDDDAATIIEGEDVFEDAKSSEDGIARLDKDLSIKGLPSLCYLCEIYM